MLSDHFDDGIKRAGIRHTPQDYIPPIKMTGGNPVCYCAGTKPDDKTRVAASPTFYFYQQIGKADFGPDQ